MSNISTLTRLGSSSGGGGEGGIEYTAELKVSQSSQESLSGTASTQAEVNKEFVSAISASTTQETANVTVTDSINESISGTAKTQAEVNKEFARAVLKGVNLATVEKVTIDDFFDITLYPFFLDKKTLVDMKDCLVDDLYLTLQMMQIDFIEHTSTIYPLTAEKLGILTYIDTNNAFTDNITFARLLCLDTNKYYEFYAFDGKIAYRIVDNAGASSGSNGSRIFYVDNTTGIHPSLWKFRYIGDNGAEKTIDLIEFFVKFFVKKTDAGLYEIDLDTARDFRLHVSESDGTENLLYVTSIRRLPDDGQGVRGVIDFASTFVDSVMTTSANDLHYEFHLNTTTSQITLPSGYREKNIALQNKLTAGTGLTINDSDYTISLEGSNFNSLWYYVSGGDTRFNNIQDESVTFTPGEFFAYVVQNLNVQSIYIYDINDNYRVYRRAELLLDTSGQSIETIIFRSLPFTSDEKIVYNQLSLDSTQAKLETVLVASSSALNFDDVWSVGQIKIVTDTSYDPNIKYSTLYPNATFERLPDGCALWTTTDASSVGQVLEPSLPAITATFHFNATLSDNQPIASVVATSQEEGVTPCNASGSTSYSTTSCTNKSAVAQSYDSLRFSTADQAGSVYNNTNNVVKPTSYGVIAWIRTA